MSTAARPLRWQRWGHAALIAMAGEVDYRVTRIRGGLYVVDQRATAPVGRWQPVAMTFRLQREAKAWCRRDHAGRAGVLL